MTPLWISLATDCCFLKISCLSPHIIVCEHKHSPSRTRSFKLFADKITSALRGKQDKSFPPVLIIRPFTLWEKNLCGAPKENGTTAWRFLRNLNSFTALGGNKDTSAFNARLLLDPKSVDPHVRPLVGRYP